MVKTVNEAFSYFLNNEINLNPKQTDLARKSRDNLIKIIRTFSDDVDFFDSYFNRNLFFGSFARHTKISPLDDIDIMICFSATSEDQTRSYEEFNDNIKIFGVSFDEKNSFLSEDTTYLNSTKVINRLISKLKTVNDYKYAEMHKNKEAATLQLKSYDWNFDIVPCFYTDRNFYLIPDGFGNWKKSNPSLDNIRTTEINQKFYGKLLDLIRLTKYWNLKNGTYTLNSYLLECMILQIYEAKPSTKDFWVDIEFKNILCKLAELIRYDFNDPKSIQGNLNYYSYEERLKINRYYLSVYEMANEAVCFETQENDQKKAIEKWSCVFGESFPKYAN